MALGMFQLGHWLAWGPRKPTKPNMPQWPLRTHVGTGHWWMIWHRSKMPTNRTMPLGGNESCNVGWGMLPGGMGHLMRSGTHTPVGFQQVGEFAQDLNFLDPVHHGLHDLVKGHYKQRSNEWRKNVDDEVAHIKSILRAQVAHDWETLTATRPSSRLGWKGRLPRGGVIDWVHGRGGKGGQQAFTQGHLADKITWH